MIRYLLDTNVVSEPTQRSPNQHVIRLLKVHELEIAIPVITLHELIYGIKRLPNGIKQQYLYDYFTRVVSVLPTLPYSPEAAEWHATERARLDKEGKKRPFVDGMIAAIAATNNLTLITRNIPDFIFYQGLSVESWFGTEGKND